jgi:(2Fe-2S) ferredoxin/sirohydrochlorin ferrochelatase
MAEARVSTPAADGASTVPPPPADRAVILLRRQDRLLTARKRFLEAAARLEARQPGARVVAAYVTRSAPGELLLGDAVARLVAGGAREIAVVPYQVEWDHPDAYDVPDAVHDLAEEYPAVTFRMGRPLGLGDDLDAITGRRLDEAWSLPPIGPAGAAGAAAGNVGNAVEAGVGAPAGHELRATMRQIVEIAGQTPITTAALKEGELPRLPAHARHLFVCHGRRCMEEGSTDTHHALTALLAERGLDSGPNAVKVTRSKCLSPCQAAPVAVAYPDGSFYCRLTPDVVPAFVDQVLVGGGELPGRTFRAGA